MVSGCATASNQTGIGAEGLASNPNSKSGVTPEGCTQMSPDLTRTTADLRTLAVSPGNADLRDTVIGDLEAVKGDWADIRQQSVQPGDRQAAASAERVILRVEQAIYALSATDPASVNRLVQAGQALGMLSPPGICGG